MFLICGRPGSRRVRQEGRHADLLCWSDHLRGSDRSWQEHAVILHLHLLPLLLFSEQVLVQKSLRPEGFRA